MGKFGSLIKMDIVFKKYRRIKYVKKYFIVLSLISIFGIGSVTAATVVCQNTVGTGHGKYYANCSGNYVKMAGYYSDTSEKYFVGNYTGNNANRYKNSAGVYAGKRNNSHSWNVGTTFSDYGHVHTYTVNLN